MTPIEIQTGAGDHSHTMDLKDGRRIKGWHAHPNKELPHGNGDFNEDLRTVIFHNFAFPELKNVVEIKEPQEDNPALGGRTAQNILEKAREKAKLVIVAGGIFVIACILTFCASGMAIEDKFNIIP